MTFPLSRGFGPALAIGLALAGSARAAQPMAFYGTSLGTANCGNPAGTADVHVIARGAGTTYTVTRLDTMATIGSGTIAAAFGVGNLTNVPAAPLRVTTSDVAYVLLDQYCSNTTNGGLTYPADDGATTVGSRVVFYDVYPTGTSNFIAGVSGSPLVTITTTGGTNVMPATAVAAGSAIQPPNLTRGTVYLVTATGGDITVGGTSGNAYSVLAASDSRASSCSNDRASRFFGNVVSFVGTTTNGAAVFNDGAAASTVTATQLIGGNNTYSIAAAANATAFMGGIAQGVYRFDATQPVAVWFGSTEGGTTINDLGDDIGVMVGRYDAATSTYRVRARSQAQQSRVYARSGSVVTVNGANTTVTPSENFTVAPNQNLVITSQTPFLVVTQGANAPNDWGKWLRPLPTVDADNDTIKDVVEAPAGACQSIAPDSDADGLADFLDVDSDNDCLTDDNPGEAGAARTNPALPPGQHCSGTTPICTVPAGATAGLCQACNGAFGSGAARACPTSTAPICAADGSCVPCNGGFGSGASAACPLATAPACLATGACVACSGDFGSGSAAACPIATAPFCTPTGACVACNGPYGGGTTEACKAPATPVCSAIGACLACNGGYQSGASLACELASAPACALGAGTCNPCNGDNGSGSTLPCPTTANPYCVTNGTCGKCATNADCVGHVLGPICNLATGACGQTCFADGDCNVQAQWCAQGVCTAKTPNGQPVPNVPPINGQCTTANGQRVCLSGVCSATDNLCGLKTGDPCDDAATECRSGICAPDGKCGECKDDSDCGTLTSGKVCDDQAKVCEDGCRGVGGNKCPGVQVCSSTTHDIGKCSASQPDAGTDGGRDASSGDAASSDSGATDATTPDAALADAGGAEAGPKADDSGVFEGGGIACSASSSSSGSFLAGTLLAALALLRRKRR